MLVIAYVKEGNRRVFDRIKSRFMKKLFFVLFIYVLDTVFIRLDLFGGGDESRTSES